MDVGVVVLTYESSAYLSSCLEALLASREPLQILVVDSSSKDGSFELAGKYPVLRRQIAKSTFNHGATREWARSLLATSIVCMITPDATVADKDAIGKLVAPIKEKRASLTYGKQLPKEGAGVFASFLRLFNYPETTHFRSMKDVSTYGSYLPFCSNSFAAYSQEALDLVGGFRSCLLGEDTLAAASLLQKGHVIGYIAEAKVFHSHSFSLWQEFCRHFDIGVMKREHEELFSLFGRDEKRGREYVWALFRHLVRSPQKIPYGCLHVLAKWFGYRLGCNSGIFPRGWLKRLSCCPSYWETVEDDRC